MFGDQFVMDVVAVFKALPEIVTAALKLVEHLKDFKSLIEELNNFLHKVNKLKTVAVETRQEIKKVVDDLKAAVCEFYKFFDKIRDVFWYGSDNARKNRIKEGIRRGDYGELSDFTDLLSRSLRKAEGQYKISMKAFQSIRSSSLKGAGDCGIKALEARSKLRTTKAVGGSTAAAVIAAGAAGGVALSVVAGVFTFGIGAIVGLSLTAAGTIVAGTAVGTGIGVYTHVTVTDLEDLEKLFSSLSKSFEDVDSSASNTLDDIRSMEIPLDSISCKLKTVLHVEVKHRVTTTLLSEVDRLFSKFIVGYNQSSECRQALKELNEKCKNL